MSKVLGSTEKVMGLGGAALTVGSARLARLTKP